MTAEEIEEQLIMDMYNAFSVMGDGWQMNDEKSKMFDECVTAAKDHALLKCKEVINTPQFGNFEEALRIEMLHHKERWGDESKTPVQHFQMVISMIGGKLAKSIFDSDHEKFEHHLITIAAVSGTAHHYFTRGDSDVRSWFKIPQHSPVNTKEA